MRQAVLVEPKHIEFREVEAPKASDLKEPPAYHPKYTLPVTRT